jgi:phosphoglycolate phosphatase-like HAD superfamily hydrolase
VEAAMNSQKILILDFDGVICNSIHDSYLTALNTYTELMPDHSLPWQKNSDQASIFEFEEQYPLYFDQFSRLIPLGNFAEDYFIIIRLLETKKVPTIRNQEDFELLKKSLSADQLHLYSETFYRNRYRMQEETPASWARLLPSFPGIQEALPVLSQRFLLAIATSKDIRSVNILLDHYGLTQYFPRQNILDKDFAQNKRDHLIRFHEMHRIPFPDLYFIDDKVSHLMDVKDLGIRGYLAIWGFNTTREHRIAESNGFTLLDLDDLLQLDSEIK